MKILINKNGIIADENGNVEVEIPEGTRLEQSPGKLRVVQVIVDHYERPPFQPGRLPNLDLSKKHRIDK